VRTYLAYGLRIRSAVPLPALPVDDGACDVSIEIGAVGAEPPAGDPGYVRVGGTAEEGIVAWDPVGRAVVRGGREIVLDPIPEADEDNIRALLLGGALGVLLTQRGLTALHASAVALDGGAVAFLGGAGWGKSTLAATLHARGHPVVADDLVAVRLDAGTPRVVPGLPQLKLWPETAAHLGDAPERLAPVRPGVTKRLRPAPAGFSTEPLPLRRVYVLAEGDGTEIEPISGRDAALELVRHSWGARSLHATAPAEQLLRCASVADAAQVARLCTPRSLAALDTLAELVEADALGSPE
jgi:hypothetical protein